MNNKQSDSKISSVNSAFTTLRKLIPTEPVNRKLSKIETLRLALSYIEHLDATLVTGEFIAFTDLHIFCQEECILFLATGTRFDNKLKIGEKKFKGVKQAVDIFMFYVQYKSFSGSLINFLFFDFFICFDTDRLVLPT